MRGPIDYIIAGFEGNVFDGSILRALEVAIENGTINLVALKLISKDVDGAVSVFEVEDAEGDLADFLKKHEVSSSLVTQEDVDEMADLLENNTSAGLLVIEQLWAIPLKEALINANGVLVAEGRIHPEAAAELSGGEN